jgi:hypothetical protein
VEVLKDRAREAGREINKNNEGHERNLPEPYGQEQSHCRLTQELSDRSVIRGPGHCALGPSCSLWRYRKP